MAGTAGLTIGGEMMRSLMETLLHAVFVKLSTDLVLLILLVGLTTVEVEFEEEGDRLLEASTTVEEIGAAAKFSEAGLSYLPLTERMVTAFASFVSSLRGVEVDKRGLTMGDDEDEISLSSQSSRLAALRREERRGSPRGRSLNVRLK